VPPKDVYMWWLCADEDDVQLIDTQAQAQATFCKAKFVAIF